MWNDPDVDMEELEARLYGQVHHGDRYDEGIPLTPNTNSNRNYNPRYFANCQPMPNFFNNYDAYNSSFSNPSLYDRLGLMNPTTVNNIMVLPPSTQIFSDTFTNRNSPPASHTKRTRTKVLKDRRKKAFKKILKGFKQHHLTKDKLFENFKSGCEVLNRSDSSCEIVEPKKDLVVISSSEDEEPNVTIENDSPESPVSTSNPTLIDSIDDDVIFVETQKVETIEIDCDDESEVVPGMPIVADSTEQNDFIESSALISSSTNTELEKFSCSSETVPSIDGSDSECSSTTSVCQPPIFDETAFTTNKDVSELNLDSFENYITTSGKFVLDDSVVLTSVAGPSTSKANEPYIDMYTSKNSSDSSSESDYDPTTVIEKPNMKLTNLSPITSDDEFVITTSQDIIEERKCVKVQVCNRSGDEASVVSISSEENFEMEVEVGDSVEMLNIKGERTFPQEEVASASVISPQLKGFAIFYTDDMNKFYKDSWGQENFSVEEEQKKMSDDPNKWKITEHDCVNISATRRGIRCYRCTQFGHKAMHCSTKSGIPKCILCGISGHSESNCPNKLCITCAQRVPCWMTHCQSCSNLRHLYCTLCSMRGHLSALCADLWRRYHITVAEGPLVRPETSTIKSTEGRWCSGCGCRGHFEHQCNTSNRRYPKTLPFIYSYADVYSYTDSNPSNPNSHDNINQRHEDTPEPLRKKHKCLDTRRITENIVQPIQLQEKPTQLDLNIYEGNCIVSDSGAAYLKKICQSTDVEIQVMKQICRGNTKYTCLITGSEQYRNSIVDEINKLCLNSKDKMKPFLLEMFFSSKSFSKEVLRNNLQKLSYNLPWCELIDLTYNSIHQYEQIFAKLGFKKKARRCRRKIQNNYIGLNAVLIGKYQAGNPKYFKLLNEWMQSDSNEASNVVKYAYRYVFEADDRHYDIDYNIVVILKKKSIQDKIKDMMQASMEMCKKLKLERRLIALNRYHKRVLEDNYHTRAVKIFKRYCTILSRKFSLRV